MITYQKLFDLLSKKGKTSTYYLRQNGFSAATVDKLRKNEIVTTETISRICALLECQPGDLMEYTPDTKK